jgi:RHS repeat-associated protein
MDSFLFNDQHGTASLAMNTTTQQVSRQQYKPYGESRTSANTAFWPDPTHGYLGAPKDTATGYTDLGARKYDPALGRFVSPDPLLQPTNLNELGGYTYAGNNPISASDPTGLSGDTGNGSGDTGVRFNPENGNVIDGGTDENGNLGNVYDGTDTPKGQKGSGSSGGTHSGSSGSSSGSSGGNSGGEAADPGNQTVTLPKALKEAMEGSPYNFSDNYKGGYTVANFAAFAGRNSENWYLVCVHLSANPMSDCSMGAPNPFRPQLSRKQNFLMAGMLALGVVGAMACGAAAEVCIPAAVELASGEASFAATGSSLGATGFGTGLVKLWGLTGACSFSQDTEVLMGDRSTKPFKDLATGDMVLAADPQTGEPEPKKIEKVWVHGDDLFALTVDGKRLVTTEDHPFWDETDHAWEGAEQLDPGDLLRTPTGTRSGRRFRQGRSPLRRRLQPHRRRPSHVLCARRQYPRAGPQHRTRVRLPLDEPGQASAPLHENEWRRSDARG